MNWILTAVVKAVLEWLESLLVRLREKQEHIEQGKKEVRDALDQREKEIDKRIDEIHKTNTDTSFDDTIRELLDSASDSDTGSNTVHSAKKPDEGSSTKTK